MFEGEYWMIGDNQREFQCRLHKYDGRKRFNKFNKFFIGKYPIGKYRRV